MNVNQPLYWHQGLFLQPQHFQHNDARLAHDLSRAQALFQPYAWGLIAMAFNESALGTRQCLLDQLSVRFRDGTLAEYPGNALLESRTFDPRECVGNGQTLYVGLRRFLPEQTNALVFDSLSEAASAKARFAVAADPQMVSDQLGSAPPAAARPMSFVLRLFWQHELEHLSEYELMPIARLEQDGERIRLVPGFIPPCVNLSASPDLGKVLRELRDEVLVRARQLGCFKHPWEAREGEAETEAGQVRLLLVLGVLSRYGPLLSHWLDTPQVQPWAMFGVLRQLIGELSVFSENCELLGETASGESWLEPYRHDDLGRGFETLSAQVRLLLDGISAGAEWLVRFERGDQWFEAQLPDAFFGARHRYYLVLHTNAEEQALGRDAKLGALGRVEVLISRALPGIELIPLQAPPQGLPRRSGVHYFRLEALSEAFEALEQERRAALFIPEAGLELQAELIAVRG